MEANVPWTALFAVGALLSAQLVIAGLSLYAYNRIRSKEDTAGQEKLSWGIRIEAANTKADTAQQIAHAMEVQHFKALRAMFEAQSLELSDAKARIASLEKELKVCQMKLASEERIERRITKARAPKPEEEEPEKSESDQVNLDELIRNHGVPLNNQPASGAGGVPAHFGKKGGR